MKRIKILSLMDSALMSLLVITSVGWPQAVIYFAALKLLVFSKIIFNLKQLWRTLAKMLPDAILLLPGVWGYYIGYIQSNPGLNAELRFYIFAPICFIILSRFITRDDLLKMERLLFHCAYLIIFVVATQFIPISFLDISKHVGEASHFYMQIFEGYVKTLYDQTICLVFIIPYFLSRNYFKRTKLNFATSSMLFTLALFTGRKSIIVLCFFVLVAMALYEIIKERKFQFFRISAIMIVLSFGIYSQLYRINILSIQNMIWDSFRFQNSAISKNAECIKRSFYCDEISSDANGALLRKHQFLTIAHEISEAPVLGKGLGFVIKHYIRSEEQPWRFELSYLGMTLNIGLLGMFIFILNYLINFLHAIKRSEEYMDHWVPLLCGSLAFITCSFTNPYIMSPMYLWIFFIPHMIRRANEKLKEIT